MVRYLNLNPLLTCFMFAMSQLPLRTIRSWACGRAGGDYGACGICCLRGAGRRIITDGATHGHAGVRRNERIG